MLKETISAEANSLEEMVREDVKKEKEDKLTKVCKIDSSLISAFYHKSP